MSQKLGQRRTFDLSVTGNALRPRPEWLGVLDLVRPAAPASDVTDLLTIVTDYVTYILPCSVTGASRDDP